MAMEADFGSDDVPESYGHGAKALVSLGKGLEMSGWLQIRFLHLSRQAAEGMMRKGLSFLGVKRSKLIVWRVRPLRAPMRMADAGGK